ncbi:MAG: TolC family protein [Meiothermus sp.]|nr:TolC family protein [Meiothermus sp.]
MLLLSAFLIGLPSPAFAQPIAAFLQNAYTRDTAYQDAERALAAAQDELRRQQGDPEAAQLSLTRAQEGVAVNQAKLAQAREESESRAVEAYAGVLVAQADVALAGERKELTALQLQAAELRFRAGAISNADLARVRDQDAQAASAVRSAQRALDQAQARLRPYGNITPQALPEPPALEPTRFAVTNHARALEAAQQAREAERALALAAGPDSPPLDRAARERDLARARAALSDVQRTLSDTLEAARRRYQSAQENLRLSRESQTRVTAELAAAQRRFQAGAIAQVTLKQSQIAKQEADRAVQAALAELWNAGYGLRVAGNQ